MPTFAQINDTEKTGFVTIITNDLKTFGLTNIIKKHINKKSIDAIQLIEKGEVHIEVIGTDNRSLYTCTNNVSGSSPHFPVQDINGVAPTSIEDLYSKLLAILS